MWDDDKAAGRPLPVSVLDAGCGVGVLGICAGRALAAENGDSHLFSQLWVRAQDRDELARAFTAFNAALNGVFPSALQAYTEPLLAGPGAPWDLILSNIPAKAGKPVLLDFISRAAALLSPGGRTALVIVNTLADLIRSRIIELGLALIRDETGKGHTVLVFGPRPDISPQKMAEEVETEGTGTAGFLRQWPAYFRDAGDFEIETCSYHIDAFQGVADFDTPSGAVQAAAKLVKRLGLRPAAGPILVHEPDQGHFPAWLLQHLGTGKPPQAITGLLVLSGRNILALEAARHNSFLALEGGMGGNDTRNCGAGESSARKTGAFGIILAPAVDLLMDREVLAAAAHGAYSFITLFPELVPQTDRLGAYWDGLAALLADGGVGVIALPSSGAERFDREKPKGFTRLGDFKRKGFRALAYRHSG
ncbi:conserved hypothetical protein [Treponema primitia ZAS-2]|uniref:Methyltransferase small domain-containing protein n=2 Tax=Treponema primitia TaxID=88058 RepID=F5YQ43_TREPZ|nr:conserved hypothetical protein [Treponema primitia ZAS-2]